MILDKQNLFSDDQAVTASAASTNIIDLGADDSYVQDFNEKMAELLVQVSEEAFATGTSLQVVLQSDNDVAFGSPTTILSSAAIPVASLVPGYQFKFGSLPLINERYLRLSYVVAGSDMTAGKLTAGLVIGKQTNKAL